MSTGCPLFGRGGARKAGAVAAALSKSNTRFSRSSFRSCSNADSSACRRRPDGSKARAKRVSDNVMLVIQTDSAGWRSSHAATAGLGTVCINALRTLVSRIITNTCRIARIGAPDPATPAAPQSDPFLQNVPQFVTPTSRQVGRVPLQHRARYAELLLPYCGRAAQRGVSSALSQPLRDDARRTGP